MKSTPTIVYRDPDALCKRFTKGYGNSLKHPFEYEG